jgi:hypothetical protein
MTESKEMDFVVARMVNAGYVGRDQEAVRKHIEELKREGIPAPDSTPTLYPVICELLTTRRDIEVVGEKTSGEVEYVLLVEDGRCLVGVGSDHTDRDMEAIDITKSKQLAPNVMCSDVWALDELEAHWDALMLRSWVHLEGKRVLYQEAALNAILPPRDLIAFVQSKLKEGELNELVIFSGTIPILTNGIIYGDSFEVGLEDPVLDRTLSCSYVVKQLAYLR